MFMFHVTFIRVFEDQDPIHYDYHICAASVVDAVQMWKDYTEEDLGELAEDARGPDAVVLVPAVTSEPRLYGYDDDEMDNLLYECGSNRLKAFARFAAAQGDTSGKAP